MKTSNKLLLGALITLMAIIIGVVAAMQINRHSNTTVGNKDIKTSIRTVPVFTQIDASNVTVNIRQSSTPGVKVTADSNIQPLVVTEVKNNTLSVYVKGKISGDDKILVDVDVPQLDQINGSAGSVINTKSPFNAEKLAIDGSSGSIFKVALITKQLDCSLSSGAIMDLTGQSDQFSIDSSSGAITNANEFKAAQVKVSGSSGAITKVYAEKTLSVDISSGAMLSYSGNPQLSIEDISSGAGLKKNDK